LSLVWFFHHLCSTSVLYDYVPYTVPLLHGGLSLCGQQPASFRTQHYPGSISSADCGALWLDAGPYTASSVLWQFSR
jgi:hypothetical protein